MTDLKCPRCHSEHHRRDGTICGHQRYRCRDCGRCYYEHTAAGTAPRRSTGDICPKCGGTDHTKSGKQREKQMIRCLSCSHSHTVEARERNSALENHPLPACPKCANPHPRRRGVDYRYETQAYSCGACNKVFRVKLTRYIRVGEIDQTLDSSVRDACIIADLAMEAGAFDLNATLRSEIALAKDFAAYLAGEIYLARIGEAGHRTIDEAISVAVQGLNHQNKRASAPTKARYDLAPILSATRNIKDKKITPDYLLNRVAAWRG